jgi:hypothetical protein
VKRLLLLDGDLFAYRNAAGAEKPVDWGDGQWTLSADEGVAVDNLEAEINETAAQLHDDHWDAVEIVVCLSSLTTIARTSTRTTRPTAKTCGSRWL